MQRALAEHQVRMLSGAVSGSDAALLRVRIVAFLEGGALCRRGHGVFGMGDHWTMHEIQHGLYSYLIGACEDLPGDDDE